MPIRLKIKRPAGFGNFRSKSNKLVRRKLAINNQKFSFFSKILNQNIIILCSTSLYRSILVYGCIDRYLLLCQVCDEFKKLKKQVIKTQNKILEKNKNKDHAGE